MKIKTVYGRLDEAEKFDARVNAAIDRGWKLGRREVLQTSGPFVCYAELVKLDEADMEPQEVELPALEAAVEALRFACACAESCGEDGCPMNAWCQKNIPDGSPPSEWTDLE